jgi:hypothetical protein
LPDEEAVIHWGRSLRASSIGTGTASLGIADALINSGKGFLVFLVLDGGRIVEVNSTGF